MTIYMDLDGPILDFLQRSYKAYKDALDLSKKERPLPKKKYWKYKRDKSSLEFIYRTSNGIYNFNGFQKRYLDNIENGKYLLRDRLSKGALSFLNRNKDNKRLVLVTLRKNRENLLNELKSLGLIHYFDKILSQKAGKEPHKIKAKLIKGDKLFNRSHSFIIGDTEVDLKAGKILGIKTIAVLNGIRSRRLLEKEKPDLIFRSIADIDIFESAEGK